MRVSRTPLPLDPPLGTIGNGCAVTVLEKKNDLLQYVVQQMFTAVWMEIKHFKEYGKKFKIKKN